MSGFRFNMLIVQIFTLLSLVVIGMIILRKIPALLKLPDKPQEVLPASSFFSRLKLKIKSWQYSEYRSKILGWLEKLLRKIRILFLKIDSFFLSGIKRARTGSRVWKAKSKAWVEQKRLRKIKKLEALEKIEKDELLQALKTTKKSSGEDLTGREKELVKAISQKPKNLQLYKDLGSLYLETKNYKDAQEAFEQALKLKPNDSEIKAKLEKIKILREPV